VLLVALLTTTLVASKIVVRFKGSTSAIALSLAKSVVAFAITTTLKPFKKLLYINVALKQLL
jgi:hypothetical protein